MRHVHSGSVWARDAVLRLHELGTWNLVAVLKYPGALSEGQLLRLISADLRLLRNCRQSRGAGVGALCGVPAIPFQQPLDCCDLLHALCMGIPYFVPLDGAPKLRESTQLAACLFAYALNWSAGVGLLASLPLGCMSFLSCGEEYQ